MTDLIQQQRYWGDQPLYIFDEWSAYCNGLTCGLEWGGKNGSYSDVLQPLEFMGYAFVLLALVKTRYSAGLDNLQEFVQWMAERTIRLCVEAQRMSVFTNDRIGMYLSAFREANDTAELRLFVERIFGQDWFQTWILGKKVSNNDYSIV